MDFRDGGGYVGTGALVRAYDERWRAFTRDHESLRVLGGLSEAGFAGLLGIFKMVGAMLAQVRSYERWTRDGERLRVLGGLSEAGFAGFIGIFGMAGAMLAQVCSYERMTRDGECLREIMRVYECWADCLKQDLQDLFGFSGWRGPCWHRCARTSV